MRINLGVTRLRLLVVAGCWQVFVRVRKCEPGSGDSKLRVACNGQRRPQRPPERRFNLQTPSPVIPRSGPPKSQRQ